MTLWLAIVAVGLTLRPTLTSVSPLLPQIRAATGMGFPVAALLTSLPVLAMGAGAFAAGALTRRLGERRGVLLGLALLAVACALRLFAGDTVLLLVTAVIAGVGIAIIQALLPGVVKSNYGMARMTAMMGLYSAALMGGGGLGAAISPVVAHWTDDWRNGLGVWLALVALAGLAWAMAPLMGQAGKAVASAAVGGAGAATPAAASASASVGDRGDRHAPSVFALLPNRRAWTLAVYFGLINCTYTTMVAWLPPFYQQEGMGATASGGLLAWMTACQVVAALVLPWLARANVDRRRWLSVAIAATLAGLVGLAVDPAGAPWGWVAALGFGAGGTFALGLVLALDHHPQPRHAATLAAFMQGVGFCIAAAAPFAAGAVRAMTGGFTPTWLSLIIVNLGLLAMTVRFNPDGYADALGRRLASHH